MSSSLPSRSSTVLAGHVHLVLLREEHSSFYLEVPLDIINSLCLRPRKYLLFLGWCVLGVEGVLALEHGGSGIDTDGGLDNCGVYHYITAEDADLTHAVDVEVIKTRTDEFSEPTDEFLEPTDSCNQFRDDLLERDGYCVWTGICAMHGSVGMHIIPYSRGSEWFRLIIENRPHYDEDVGDLRDIDDIRNGIFAAMQIHTDFDRRFLVILKTPNRYLGTEDIHNRTLWREGISYPTDSRFTLQWLETEPFIQSLVPNNIDAAFLEVSDSPKPSDLLLHYNYGAAAVKRWGHGIEVLKKRANPPRPPEPVLAPTGTRKKINDGSIAIRGSEEALAPAAGAGDSLESVELEGQAKWDEDDVMLFLWGNSPAAKQRHLKKVEEKTRRMEQWREGLPRVV